MKAEGYESRALTAAGTHPRRWAEARRMNALSLHVDDSVNEHHDMHALRCLAARIGLSLGTAAQAQTHEFGDWTIACDNTRHCEALGYQSMESGSAAVVLWLSRDAGPNAPVSIQLGHR